MGNKHVKTSEHENSQAWLDQLDHEHGNGNGMVRRVSSRFSIKHRLQKSCSTVHLNQKGGVAAPPQPPKPWRHSVLNDQSHNHLAMSMVAASPPASSSVRPIMLEASPLAQLKSAAVKRNMSRNEQQRHSQTPSSTTSSTYSSTTTTQPMTSSTSSPTTATTTTAPVVNTLAKLKASSSTALLATSTPHAINQSSPKQPLLSPPLPPPQHPHKQSSKKPSSPTPPGKQVSLTILMCICLLS